MLKTEYALTNTKGSLWEGPLESHLLFSRVYNDRGADGTTGQTMSMVYGDKALRPGIEDVIAGLEQSTSFRSAIGLLNTSTKENTFTIELYDENGTLLATRDEAVPPMSLHHINKVYTALAGENNVRGYAIVRSTQQGSVYGSLVDQSTGDASTITPVHIDTSDNQAPVFEGNDVFCDGIDDGLVDVNPKDGVIDRGILAYISDNYSGCILASDADGDSLTYSWTDLDRGSLPPGFSYQGRDWTWNLGAPGITPGLYNLQVTVTDNRGGEFTELQRWDIRTPPQ